MPEVILSNNNQAADPELEKLGSSGHQSQASSLTPSPTLELSTKHPLQNSWTLWYFKNDRSKDWEYNQKEVITFNTVEDFWALYNHIELASHLMAGCDYSLFKQGIKPMWEDECNKDGGKWLLLLDKKQRSVALDSIWLEVMMCLIGEAFGELGSVVNGAVVNIRGKGDKLSIWLAESQDKRSIMTIGHTIKDRLKLTQPALNFEVHRDAMTKNSSTIKPKFLI